MSSPASLLAAAPGQSRICSMVRARRIAATPSHLGNAGARHVHAEFPTRAGVRAYACLLYADRRSLSELFLKRLRIISGHTRLGSGFKIDLKGLEIRGAGNTLGLEQHGCILSVGYDLRLKLLPVFDKLPSQDRTAPRSIGACGLPYWHSDGTEACIKRKHGSASAPLRLVNRPVLRPPSIRRPLRTARWGPRRWLPAPHEKKTFRLPARCRCSGYCRRRRSTTVRDRPRSLWRR